MNAWGRVFSIEEFSVFDGPGIRTSVFLKGCNLHCSWCHNPEGQSKDIQIVKSPNGCLNCGACKKAALLLKGKEELCEASVAACPNKLIRISGEDYTAESLCDRLFKNQQFYETSGGGVTFSGGEPLMQSDFILACAKLLRGKVHLALQTAGMCKPEIFDRVLSEMDYVLFDIKLVREERLKRYTGADANIVYRNFDTLVKSGKDFVVRIPLIPGVTDTKENIADIIACLKGYGITYAEAMPYNKMAGAKYTMVGRTYQPDFDPAQDVYIPEKEFSENGIELCIL